jgi:hypothetical protein
VGGHVEEYSVEIGVGSVKVSYAMAEQVPFGLVKMRVYVRALLLAMWWEQVLVGGGLEGATPSIEWPVPTETP